MFKWLGTKPITYTLAEIPIEVLRDEVTKYTTAIETGETSAWCSCTWVVHPDDVAIKSGHCRVCNSKRAHKPLPEDLTLGEGHEWKGIRRRLLETNMECPAHTKEGLLLGFIKWMEKRHLS